MKCRKMMLGMSVGISVLLFTSSFSLAMEPGKLLMETVDKGLTVLKEPSLSGTEKTQERRQALWKEISIVFNFEEMSKRALGQHWKKRSPEEKKEFVELFTNILKDAYIGKTDTYNGEKVVLLREKQDSNYAVVQTRFITKNGTEIAVDYSMLNNSGEWKIYDVIIEGVSMINNYRSQFNNILLKSPYENLVKRMKEKTTEETATQ
ncbi:MAG: ABC transporter substrate-binding protein [Planctomycetota bacterium]